MEVNELMVSWWWEVIAIVGILGVGSLSGCLIWYGKMLRKEKEKFKKREEAMDENYSKLWDLKDQFRDEKELLSRENSMLKR